MEPNARDSYDRSEVLLNTSIINFPSQLDLAQFNNLVSVKPYEETRLGGVPCLGNL